MPSKSEGYCHSEAVKIRSSSTENVGIPSWTAFDFCPRAGNIVFERGQHDAQDSETQNHGLSPRELEKKEFLNSLQNDEEPLFHIKVDIPKQHDIPRIQSQKHQGNVLQDAQDRQVLDNSRTEQDDNFKATPKDFWADVLLKFVPVGILRDTMNTSLFLAFILGFLVFVVLREIRDMIIKKDVNRAGNVLGTFLVAKFG